MNKLSTRKLISAAILILYVSLASGHGDIDKPLYISPNGDDAGTCTDPSVPCRTLKYAMGLSGKGGQIRAAEGNYEINSADDLFLLLSESIDIRGGYDLESGTRPSSNKMSVISGVPAEYRADLRDRGFSLIADSKAMSAPELERAGKLLALGAQVQQSMSSAPCINGSVNGLSCEQVDLLSHVALGDVTSAPISAADVWGFVDLNTFREYAIVGFRTGTAVFDVTDAEFPQEIGFIPGQTTTWRDVKVYQYYDDLAGRWHANAYVTADGASEGLFILDLSGLPHSIRRTSHVSDYSSAHNVFATDTDFATGVSLTGNTPTLVIAGPGIGDGRYRSYQLTDPNNPQFVSAGSGYMHDASSMLLTDSRKDTQCVNGGTHCEVLFDFNENAVGIWDITDGADPELLGSTSYANASYVHSGWWSEDKQFFFTHDELDEQRFGLQTTLRVFSIADLRNPVQVGAWSGPTTAIDHNGFVRGNRYYMSNYARGLTILDISNPATPVAVGNLDTYPTDSSNFVGAWGTYPFFHSGNIAISDINSGFYMAADQTRDVPQGSLSFATNAWSVVEGTQSNILVARNGGSTGAISVDFEVIGATADSADYSIASGTLSWGNGDVSNRSVLLNASNDGIAEGLEHLMVRLIAPTGSATLGNLSTAHVYISDPGAASEFNFFGTNAVTAEQGFATAVVTVHRQGSAEGAVSVDVDISGGDATLGTDFTGSASTTLNWTDGDATPKSVEFIIVDDGTGEADEFFELTLTNANAASIGSNNVLRVNIGDGSGINQAPNAVAGNSQAQNSGTPVTLDGSQSSDPDGDALIYNWQQILGTTVALSGQATAVATFTAPTVSSDTMLQFRLSVSDNFGQTDTSTTTVTIRAPGGNGGGGGALSLLLMLALASTALIRRRSISQTDVA